MGQGSCEPSDSRGFRRLTVWQKSYTFVLGVYGYSKTFPGEERYGLTSQLQRAVISIPANIAEGYERNHRKEYLQFLHIARGSLGEVETYLLLGRDLGYLTNEAYQFLEKQRCDIAKLLKGLINSLS
jgi:four helix bundle protein